MMTDKSLLFFENKTETATGTAIEVNGSDYGRSFVFCTLPVGPTAVKLEVMTGDTAAAATTVIATKSATAEELAKGLMAVALPHDLGKFVNAKATITGATTSGVATCGITDAIPNGPFVK